MRNTVISALGAILAVACTIEIESVEEPSKLDAEDGSSAPVDDRFVAATTEVSVPAELQALAEALVPAEARRQGYFLHFSSLGTSDEIEQFRVTYGPLELGVDEMRIGAPVAVTELEFDHYAETAIACHTGDCALDLVTLDDTDLETAAWRPIDALTAKPDVANVVTWVVRFYTNTNYSGTTYSLTYDVTNNGLFLLGVPNTAAVNGNDVWSSFRTYDATCPGCLVNGKRIDVYDVTVYRDTNFVGPVKNFGGTDSDPTFANDTYSGGGGSVDNSISSFKASVAVFDPPQCGNGVCGPGESYITCWQDCPPPCGDGICQNGQNNYTCPQDCPVCGDGLCQGNELGTGCPQDCCFGYQGACTGTGACCNSDFDCGWVGGACLMIAL